MPAIVCEQVLPDLWRFADSCNVYVVRGGDECLAIDFGSGAWLKAFDKLGLPPLRRVLLTHHHAGQCGGLLTHRRRAFEVHAGRDERRFLGPAEVKAYWRGRRKPGIPASYHVLPRGLTGVHYDLGGFEDIWWGDRRIRLIHTPGHGPHALSILIDIAGKQVVFCGDAAHAGATVWQPYNLEWDHWTGGGTLAAWEGVRRLANLGIDVLCPSHGPIITRRPRAMLDRLSDKLLALYHAKGNICPGERDDYHAPVVMACGARQVLPHLYQWGENGYLLVSKSGEGLVIDAWNRDLSHLTMLVEELGRPRITAGLSTHYHLDHVDGFPALRRRLGLKLHLHPWVARALRSRKGLCPAWAPPTVIAYDGLLPEKGRWRWHEYDFRVAPYPGQTWWHAAHMVRIDGRKVLFGGDSFQPNSRWNATGGFCAMHGCRFREGFACSARQTLRWKPDLIANGHGTYQKFRPSQYRKIIRWAGQAERALKALCPSGDLGKDYHLLPI